MALPPYVDKANLQLFWAVLSNDDEHLVPSLRHVGLGQDTPKASRTEMSSFFLQSTPMTQIGTHSAATHHMARSGVDANDLSAVWGEMDRLRRRLESLEGRGEVLELLPVASETLPQQVRTTSLKLCNV